MTGIRTTNALAPSARLGQPRERVSRGDGRTWQDRHQNGRDVRVIGTDLVVLRTHRVAEAREIVATRWHARHGQDTPIPAGLQEWRRHRPAGDRGFTFELSTATEARSFPAVRFPAPEAST